MQFYRVTASSRNSRKRSPKRIMPELSLTPLERGGTHSYCFWTRPSQCSAGGLGARVPLPLVVVSTTWLMTLPSLTPALSAARKKQFQFWDVSACPPQGHQGPPRRQGLQTTLNRSCPPARHLVHSGESQVRVLPGKRDSELWR